MRTLIQMETGSGKTFTAVNFLYHVIKPCIITDPPENYENFKNWGVEIAEKFFRIFTPHICNMYVEIIPH